MKKNAFAGLAQSAPDTPVGEGFTLTRKSFEAGLKALEQHDRAMRQHEIDVVSQPGWQEHYHLLHDVANWLHEQGRYEDCIVIERCRAAMMPFPVPCSIRTRDRAEVLISEYEAAITRE